MALTYKLWAIGVIASLFSCNVNSPKPVVSTSRNQPQYTFLALGDSYTVGTSVKPSEAWPFQLSKNIGLKEPIILAQAGYTSNDLIRLYDSRNITDIYDLVSLQIGVNNQYRGQKIENFKTDFELLISKCIERAGGKKNRVIVLSIPDWGAIPSAGRDAARIGVEIDLYNNYIKSFCKETGVIYFDITELSRLVKSNMSLASDEFHFSGSMYQKWVEKIGPEVLTQLKK